MTKSFLLILPILFFFLCTGCTIIGYDGQYEGRIVDFETQKPIEGAVVFGEWHRVSPTPAGAVSSFYDYKETLTDKNGNFKLDGVGLLLFSNIDKPTIGLFKAGYEQPYSTYWNDFKDKKYHPDIDVDDSKLVFKLRQMTFEQRLKRYVEIKGPGTLEKNKLIWLERNREIIETCRDHRENMLFPTGSVKIIVSPKTEKFCKEQRNKEFNENRRLIPMGGMPPRAAPQQQLLKEQ
jgi:hypothetical protein